MRKFVKYIYLFLILTLASCSTSLYDHYTHTETLETKVQANSLIRQSVNPYAENIQQVESFKAQLEKMLTYEQSKNKNPINIKMWEFVNNDQNSIHGFLKLWKEQGRLSPDFVGSFEEKVNLIFDKMLDFETKKDKESESALLSLLNTIQ